MDGTGRQRMSGPGWPAFLEPFDNKLRLPGQEETLLSRRGGVR